MGMILIIILILLLVGALPSSPNGRWTVWGMTTSTKESHAESMKPTEVRSKAGQYSINNLEPNNPPNGPIGR
jgi:hypothetical protein